MSVNGAREGDSSNGPSTASASSAMTASPDLVSKAGPEESLRSYRLLEALKSGNAENIKKVLKTYEGSTNANCATYNTHSGTSTPLHLAVRIAKTPTVELVLKNSPACVNAQDSRGQTPLHLAAHLNRIDVMSMFLQQPHVDDSIKDFAGNTCAEAAAGPEMAAVITKARGLHADKYVKLLADYCASPSADSTVSRISQTLTPTKVSQPPSEADAAAVKTPAEKEDQAGAPKVSAAAGHVSNAAAEALYHFVAYPRSGSLDFNLKDKATGLTVLHEAAKRKDLGLIKLVISKGGDVLARDRKGKLPVDYAKDDRIKNALRQIATSEGQAIQAGEGGAPVKYGRPPAMRGYLDKYTNVTTRYKPRWFVCDNGILSYYHTQSDEGKASRGSINLAVARIEKKGDLKFEVRNTLGKNHQTFWLKGKHEVEVMRWIDSLEKNIEYAREGNGLAHVPSGTTGTASRYASSISSDRKSPGPNQPRSLAPSRQGSPPGSVSFMERDGSMLADDDTFLGDEDEQAPRSDDFEMLVNAPKAELEVSQQLLTSLSAAEEGSDSTSRRKELQDAMRNSLNSLTLMIDEFADVVQQRERFFIRKYEREIQAKRLWEENMKEVAAQQAAMEVELQKASRDSTRRKRALQEVRANLATLSPTTSPPISPDSQLPPGGSDSLPSALAGAAAAGGAASLAAGSGGTRSRSESEARTPTALSPTRTRLRSSTVRTLGSHELEQIVDEALGGESGDEYSEDDDEFFEAVESGSIPINEEPVRDKELPASAQVFMESMDMTPYKGYEHLREKLPITKDNRPPVSLWAILKGSIGKDLTKISFPVFFNEPTSMLQRMAEDMEFTEPLDSAAAEQDPAKRIAFVAAFAMSNYSSTIGRIAKPFNPMLGETFEYVDLNRKYRYISEQVSHHPPISACIAQSPRWEYFGEVDAKSKFLGKSFEIRPTGIAHVRLRIPKEWAPDAPVVSHMGNDIVAEHYSWTKVTTSVSNFLFGSPQIDHFGDMVIKNHRTGHKCTLTFKPRGWRGSGACEIKGKVTGPDGEDLWDVAGKWDSQLVARKCGVGHGDLAPDAKVPTNGDTTEIIRLWKNSTKPPGMPFNLTPFAITLNDNKQEIVKWLPPTDCRLRPDQHAFESGQFEKANDLKSALEEHQRETRRKRERGELPPHQPRWFTRTRDPDTGESYWKPVEDDKGQLEYWEERTRVGKAHEEGKKDVEWDGVDPIYADFMKEVK